MSLVQRLFNARMLPAALPKVIYEDSLKLRGLFWETAVPTLPQYVPKKAQPWLDALAERFHTITGQEVQFNTGGGYFGNFGKAIAQRINGTNNTRIATNTSVPMFDTCHEFVHGLQNTFKSMQEPLVSDKSANAIGQVDGSMRAALNLLHEYFMGFRQNLYSFERGIPSKTDAVLKNLEAHWKTLPVEYRQQGMLYYLQELQAQGIPLKPLKECLDAKTWQKEKFHYHELRQFMKVLIDMETKLGQNGGFNKVA